MPPSYPGQRPYPGASPTSGKIPAPSIGKKGKKAEPVVPTQVFTGMFKQMDSKTVTLAMDDNREVEFKRNDKTKFFKEGEELAAPVFQRGDKITVDAQEDAKGYLTAVNVYWEMAATASAQAGGAPLPDAWAGMGAPPTAPAAAPGPVARATVERPPASKPDSEDPGPPRLQRGGVADSSRLHAPEPPSQSDADRAAALALNERKNAEAVELEARAAAISADSSGAEADLSFGSRQQDPMIRKAANAALDFTETLPSYVCQEVVARYGSSVKPANWSAIDVVGAELVFDKGREDYRNLTINGKPVKSKIEETGAWSTGEFGSLLIGLFAPGTATTFRFQKDSRVAGVNAKAYAFSVARENSRWQIHIASQTYVPAYSGTVWIEPAAGRVLRIEMQANGLPEEFPADHVESSTDYEFVRLGSAKQFLLPVHAEVLTCQRGTNNCNRNTIDFRNYHKFEGESTVTFGDAKE
jgi:hypothetical protein